MPYEWTTQLAYAIGLITTDGWLSSDRRHMGLTSSDIQLLKTFCNCLNLRNKITKNPRGSYSKRQSYRVQFGNVVLYKWLLKIGLFSHKTYSIGKIDVPKDFFADFIRGHLDGDGSIIVYIDTYNTFKSKKYVYTRLYIILCSASLAHIEWIRSILQEILGIQGSINYCDKNGQSVKVWRLRFAKKESLKLLPWLYYSSDVPCLKRKRKIAERFLKNYRH